LHKASRAAQSRVELETLGMPKDKTKAYDKALKGLQRELVTMMHWAQETGARVLVLIEGRDTAGKGGVISAIRAKVNPRQCRVVALPKPTEREASEWYFQRYVQHLPAAGEVVLFDRSWYNRAGVEKVMGFANDDQVEAFLKAAPTFENLLVDEGILLFKYWLCCDQEEQEQRFAERHADPLKGWKLSPIDLSAREKYDDYTKAREVMLKATHTKQAPWTLVDFNDQKRGRLTLIRDLLDRLPDREMPAAVLELAPLEGKLSKEKFKSVEPIKSFDL
jgi:polyphosphate kinase 2